MYNILKPELEEIVLIMANIYLYKKTFSFYVK